MKLKYFYLNIFISFFLVISQLLLQSSFIIASAEIQPYEVWTGDYFDKPIPNHSNREFYFPDINVPTSGFDVPSGYKLGFIVYRCGERSIGSDTFSSSPGVKFMYVSDNVDSLHATVSPFQWIGSTNFDTLLISASGYSRSYSYYNGTWSSSSGGNFNSPSRVYPHEKVFSVLPFYIDNEEVEPPLFSMQSISTSSKQSLLDVAYNGSSADYYSVGFYACTASDFSSWWGSATADIASQSFTYLPSLDDDGSQPWYIRLFDFNIVKTTTRITPTNHLHSHKKNITTLPSPRVVIGYDSVSQIKSAQSIVNWQDWVNNSDMGGVYGSTDIVIVARIAYTHTDLITGNTITDYYFCNQQFDISSIISSAYTPDQLNTPIEDTHPPTEGSINSLENLAQYLSYLFRTSNDNDVTLFNNFISKMSEDAPLYVLGGLNGWLPNLSGELDSLFNSLFDDLNIDFSVPSDEQINSLKSEIDLKEEAFNAKFYWVSQIQTEVHFVTSTVISAGDTPPIVAVDANYNSPSADRHVNIGHLVLFDATKIDSLIVSKAKDIITVFLSLGLLWYIFRTLPSTIGNTPNE